jgi:PHD/YefM family antitoxin component YafN of YafNO toxin-antitoxin module
MPVAGFDERILSATEARQNFFKVLSDVRSGQPVTIHVPRQEDVTMVPRAFLAALLREMEALTLRIESEELAKDDAVVEALKKSENDIAAGRTIELHDAQRILKERRRRQHGHR